MKIISTTNRFFVQKSAICTPKIRKNTFKSQETQEEKITKVKEDLDEVNQQINAKREELQNLIQSSGKTHKNEEKYSIMCVIDSYVQPALYQLTSQKRYLEIKLNELHKNQNSLPF